MARKIEDEQENEHDSESTPASEEEDKDYSNRRVFLFGRLENEVALPVIKRMLKLNDRDPKTPVDLIINSAGGNGYNADAIIATMYSMQAPVNTICYGHALSGACEILASGTGKRYSYEFATLMFHQTLWEADGDITNLEIQAKQGQKFREAQIELLSRVTGQDRKRLRRDIERDFYLSAAEALEYGIIDEMIVHNKTRRNFKFTPVTVDGAKPKATAARTSRATAKTSSKNGSRKVTSGRSR
jgi:ATP-dependent Clp protease protease subunit